jgi:murein DD-endopeptidase MepM/ murein hydrolase activator NlpD
MTFDKFLSELPAIEILQTSGNYIPIDLSAPNAEAAARDSAQFSEYIDDYLSKHNGSVAYGGYNELRNLYKRSELFKDPDSEERNIHIGLDLWTNAGTAVLTPLDGKIHSFDYNAGLGNYGPTIILAHNIGNHSFYTLYGHLSMESIEEIEIGDTYSKGQPLATLGDSTENGDYAPHLHFQIIRDIDGYFGDYPGVCSKSDLKNYLKNCPDPNLLLKLN